jgi:uncharacterized protein (TIGR00288 family)
MNEKLKIAVFVDYDNIEIGVKSTLQRDLDIAMVLDSLKERGDIVAKFAYADWGRQEGAKRQMAENAVQMVQRIPSPRGDKNGADINLALDALEMAFTHDHVNAFAIISGDSDFIPLVNKLKEYGKTIFVVGGRAFTSTILQKNCHEFISFESLMDEVRPQRQQHAPQPQQHAQQQHGQQPQQQGQRERRRERRRPEPLDLGQAMPLVERALTVLERREVTPQLGLLKSTMLQLDPTFSEKAYGSGTFTDFVEKLKNAGYVDVSGAEGRYVIERKGGEAKPEEPAHRPDEVLPILRDVLETHRIEMDAGCMAEDLENWVHAEHSDFEPQKYGFQEFTEVLNFAQDKLVVRVEPDEERGLLAYLGAGPARGPSEPGRRPARRTVLPARPPPVRDAPAAPERSRPSSRWRSKPWELSASSPRAFRHHAGHIHQRSAPVTSSTSPARARWIRRPTSSRSAIFATRRVSRSRTSAASWPAAAPRWRTWSSAASILRMRASSRP